MAAASFDNLDTILSTYIPAEHAAEVRRLIYGDEWAALAVPAEVTAMSERYDFEVRAFAKKAAKESTRRPKTVRVAVVQNSVVLPTTEPIEAQRDAIFEKIGRIIDAAAGLGANILCLQEAWTMPFAFCTREKQPWMEFAEDVYEGAATKFLSNYARRYNMVIVSPILERDSTHSDTVWNTAVVISNSGEVLGKHRKNHIPRVGDFNESTYYFEGNTGHPVFSTAFGKIGINICYGRHFPLNWQAFALNGAEIVFNPCATVGGLSEPLWPVEARNAAIANNYFAFAINRVGTETFPNEFTSGDGKPAHRDFGAFYGSSYGAGPDGSRCPGLSRVRDGLLVTEVDLNLNRQVRDKWTYQMTARLDMYAKLLGRYIEHDFEPQVIVDSSAAGARAV
eukprot:c12928_g1_i1.p1 GENE.c12928_g1_i1~~c12928_g1_i1.p1  ORF type:complete len:403 (-),score=82.76 c12928_g1_i1:17-1198(-)